MNGFATIVIARRRQDAEGFATVAYDCIASTRVYREGKHGSERWANLSSIFEATDLFRFRTIPCVKVTVDHTILCDGETFDIVSVEDVKGRGMYTEVLAKKVIPTNG